ncbi:EAL domain-containing protein [Spiribacter halobius]|uniref:EAL domain-containing protein n=1 Tax=Sediminicurvatus halobius TaxID=2182432 RepID=UPI0018EE63E3|nr:EAL domain-containing protein [Spiribacter halobius]UEX78741.1 EAL domain-containing protein [Spiribacter halobius]
MRPRAFAPNRFGSRHTACHHLHLSLLRCRKVNGRFVRPWGRRASGHALRRIIRMIAGVMGLHTVAEFVETAPVARALRRIGVGLGQGFGLHRPEDWVSG